VLRQIGARIGAIGSCTLHGSAGKTRHLRNFSSKLVSIPVEVDLTACGKIRSLRVAAQ